MEKQIVLLNYSHWESIRAWVKRSYSSPLPEIFNHQIAINIDKSEIKKPIDLSFSASLNKQNVEFVTVRKELLDEYISQHETVYKIAIAQDSKLAIQNEIPVKFLEWTIINGWKKLNGIWEYSNGELHKTGLELYDIYINEKKQKHAPNRI